MKRKTRSGLIFFADNRNYRSKTYNTYEERDKGIEKYIENQLKVLSAIADRVKKEKELLNK